MSGGPVFNDLGQVIGIVHTATEQGKTWLFPSFKGLYPLIRCLWRVAGLLTRLSYILAQNAHRVRLETRCLLLLLKR